MGDEHDFHKTNMVNKEQLQHMERHRWICSEKLGYDVGETGFYDWVDKHAKDFRSWVDTIPFRCLECGFCEGSGLSGLCQHPFDIERYRKLRDRE